MLKIRAALTFLLLMKCSASVAAQGPDIDECVLGLNSCEHTCIDTEDSYKCGCKPGFTLSPDGEACQDQDECVLGLDSCEHDCIDTVGSYTCGCKPGFTLSPDGETCQEGIDECVLDLDSCEHTCIKTEDSYKCDCEPGFTLTSDGKTCLESSCSNIVDICFVVDVSGSIEGDGGNPGYFDRYVKLFLREFARMLKDTIDNIQIGMVTFGNFAELKFPLTPKIDDVIAGINNIVYQTSGENTNTSAGINIMRTEVLGKNSPNYRQEAAHFAIVVTDGLSTRDHNKTVPCANDAKKQGITMMSIGVTRNVDVKELVDIASYDTKTNFGGLKDAIAKGVFMSSGFVSYVPTIPDLKSTLSELASHVTKEICG